MRLWYRLPRKVVDIPALEVFKAWLDDATLGDLIYCLI